MQNFKFLTFAFLAVFAVSSVIFVNSCTKDLCKDVVCQNGGTCAEGVCGCLTGFEGTNCETSTRTKFVASYNASESKNSGTNYSYQTVISTSSSAADKVSITHLGGTASFFNAAVIGTISNSTTLTIASQQPDNDGYTVVGSGTISGSVITLTYSITGLNGATPPVSVTDNFSATWTKQ